MPGVWIDPLYTRPDLGWIAEKPKVLPKSWLRVCTNCAGHKSPYLNFTIPLFLPSGYSLVWRMLIIRTFSHSCIILNQWYDGVWPAYDNHALNLYSCVFSVTATQILWRKPAWSKRNFMQGSLGHANKSSPKMGYLQTPVRWCKPSQTEGKKSLQ